MHRVAGLELLQDRLYRRKVSLTRSLLGHDPLLPPRSELAARFRLPVLRYMRQSSI